MYLCDSLENQNREKVIGCFQLSARKKVINSFEISADEEVKLRQKYVNN